VKVYIVLGINDGGSSWIEEVLGSEDEAYGLRDTLNEGRAPLDAIYWVEVHDVRSLTN